MPFNLPYSPQQRPTSLLPLDVVGSDAVGPCLRAATAESLGVPGPHRLDAHPCQPTWAEIIRLVSFPRGHRVPRPYMTTVTENHSL